MEKTRTNTYPKIMKTKEAISRLAYTIGKSHKPNETDKLALNSIITFINKSDQEAVQENNLFAKLYVFLLREFLLHYNHDIDFANKQLNRELSYPLSSHIELLTNELKCGEMMRFFKEKGVVDDFYVGKSWPEASRLYQENKKVFPEINPREFLEACEFWTTENVEATLNRQINESLIEFKND
jgi:hypothetical protein